MLYLVVFSLLQLLHVEALRTWHTRTLMMPQIRQGMKSNPFIDVVSTESDIPQSKDLSQLPDSFEDAVLKASRCTVELIKLGTKTCRIDFDTTVADMTYTSLKNTMPMCKAFVGALAADMQLQTNSSEGPGDTMRLFFPDMGAAALVRRDWKMGTELAEVPACVQTANIKNDPLLSTDRVAILLCPLYSESDYVKRVVEECAASSIPCIMINPELINMDQGFGVRARNMRKTLLAQFVTTYKLRTMKQGALVREWPRGFAVWNEDASQEEGYSLLRCYTREPTREMMDELFDVANPDLGVKPTEPGAPEKIFAEISGFFKGMQKL